MTFIKNNWIWLLPSLMLVFFSLFSTTSIDSTHDFIMSYRIINGENFPLLGRQLALSFHIGPLWDYLMTLPLMLSNSWLSLAIFVAMLNGIKFYLAYQVGIVLKDNQLGQLLVLAMLMVSFTAMQTITFTHTSITETCMLLMIYFSVKSPLNKQIHWFILGFLFALAFHAHPTAVVAGYFALNKWVKNPHKIFSVTFFLLGTIPLFAPVLIALFLQQGNETAGVLVYFSQQTNGFDLVDIAKLIYGLVFISPWSMLSTGLPLALVIVLFSIQAMIQFSAILIPIINWKKIDARLQRMHLMFTLFFILSSLGLILIRSRTPWYMTYGLSLAYSMVIASGLYIIFQNNFHKSLRSAIMTTVFLTFLLCHSAIIYKLNHNQTRLPSAALHDLRSMNHDLSTLGYEILAKDAKHHGQFTCEQQPVALHGPYAALVHSHSGIEHLSQCGEGLYYGPAKNTKHLIGVPSYYQKHIKTSPIYQIADTYFYQPISVATGQKVWQEQFQDEYQRRLTYAYKSNWQQETTEAEIKQGQSLLITKLLGFKMHLKILQVTVDGIRLKPTAENNYSTLYMCENCNPKNSSWQIKYQESVAGMTNLVSF